MTHIHIAESSEVNSPEWSYQTLRPPAITIQNMARDLAWHLRLYKVDRLPSSVILQFLLLRVVQRVAYNMGWRKGYER